LSFASPMMRPRLPAIRVFDIQVFPPNLVACFP